MEIHRTLTAAGKNLEKALKDLNGLEGKVGWFQDSKYDETGEYVAAIAAQNEYGNPNKNIPARPFMRPTIQEQQNKWLNTASKVSAQVLEGKLSAHNAMEIIAIQAENDVLKKIKSIYEPPLSPYTIARRLSKYKNQSKIGNLTKPLVDTGRMIGTLTHEVSKS